MSIRISSRILRAAPVRRSLGARPWCPVSSRSLHHTSMGDVTRLLKTVESSTKVYLDYLQSKNLPEPSYQHGNGLDPRVPLPVEVAKAHQAAIEATDELHHLLLGPLVQLFHATGEQLVLLSIQYIYEYGIAAHVPLEGSISMKELAQLTGLNVKDLTRFLRVAISRHIFDEPEKGQITHTASSKLLINNPMVQSWLMNIAQEFWPAFSRTVEATKKWPGSEEPHEAGYSLSNGTSSNPFDHIKKDPKRQQQFIEAMRFSHLHPEFHLSHLLENYKFDQAGNSPTIVDIGGSNGEVSIEIASRYPNAQCIVQDLPDTIAGLKEHVPLELRDRVTGMAHDFLTPQPIKGADIYLLRWILHDWSDLYCIKILRNLIPALKQGARVVINDICIPEPGQLGPKANRELRFMDISMKAFNNARERDVEAWKDLFERTDPNLHLLGISVPNGGRMAIIEAEWRGD